MRRIWVEEERVGADATCNTHWGAPKHCIHEGGPTPPKAELAPPPRVLPKANSYRERAFPVPCIATNISAEPIDLN